LFYHRLPGDLPLHVLQAENPSFHTEPSPNDDQIRDSTWLKKMKSVLEKSSDLSADRSRFEDSVFYYVFDIASLKLEKKLNIRFYHATPNGSTEAQSIAPVPIYNFSPERIKDPVDRHVLSLLFTFSQSGIRSSYARPNLKQITLASEFVVPALTALINTGRLFTSEEAVINI